ncbi:hypothetical protein [Paenibacillus hexagrammi]|uniref:Bacteriocin n=1 Tax=Paenibacillus hexagrammi TaxID=2908839 RepID=A0ABY3SKL1_9BACL|nr:hypothetical protein [Paenibacillus sp. YPD9-1]UJF33522.1 hypothetical protein L0M14_29165 [Paenibacillus sp. YPD9-1]
MNSFRIEELSQGDLEQINGGFSFGSFAAGVACLAGAVACDVAAMATAPTVVAPAALIVGGAALHTAGIGMIAHSFVE